MLCDLAIEENPVHIVMQCPFHEKSRKDMHGNIKNLTMEI